MMKRLMLFLLVGISTLSCTDTFLPEVSISDQERADLIFLREEEKLAHDVYAFSARKYGLPIFSNITASEERHMQSVLTLLTRFGIPDPVQANAAGVFHNAELQTLYNGLVDQSSRSLVEALRVGATIEDLDIHDIDRFYAHTSNTAIIDVYDRLACGSKNHLRAFVNQLQTRSLTYSPQHITQSKFDDIIDAPNGRCGKGFQN